MKFQGVRTLLLYSSAFILLSFMLSSCNQGVNQIQLLPNEYRDSILNERKNTLEMYLNNEYELIRSSISSYHDSLVTINQKISLIIKEDSFKNSLNPLISPKELKINKDIRVSLLQKIDSLRLRQFELHTKTESELKIIGHYYSAFPVDDIKLCLNDTLNRNDFINHLDCPICGRKSDKLLWINFRSPDYTWKNMMGREGPLSICETCKVQIEFIPYIMN